MNASNKATIYASLLATLACATSAMAAPESPEVVLDIAVGEPVMLAGKEQKAYVKISLVGFEMPQSTARPPVNLALVLDRSSSMSGDKFDKAKLAASMVIDRLSTNDIVSIITYDSTVEVLVPATKVSNRDALREAIMSLEPRGSTALFAGVSHGISQVEKFLDKERVSRVILLSDGQANVGPSSPNELGYLGESAGKRGISVSTIGLGLGYNEDLMSRLALASDGNHGFAETADELATIFNYELGDVLSVVAQDVDIEIEFDRAVRPIRGLNRELEIHGHKAVLSLNQLYSKQEKYFLIEVAVPPTTAGTKRDLANVALSYNNMLSKKRARLQNQLAVSFASSKQEVAKSENREVMVAAVEAIAVERNRQAVALRDQGKVKEAQKVLLDNANELKDKSQRYRSTRLETYGKKNVEDASNLEGESWNRQRKAMRKTQHTLETNQSY